MTSFLNYWTVKNSHKNVLITAFHPKTFRINDDTQRAENLFLEFIKDRKMFCARPQTMRPLLHNISIYRWIIWKIREKILKKTSRKASNLV